MRKKEILKKWQEVAEKFAEETDVRLGDRIVFSWDNFKEQIRSLKNRLGFSGETLDFLGYSIDLNSGKVVDHLINYTLDENPFISYLAYYAESFETVLEEDGWVKFRHLPGGISHENAFKIQVEEWILNRFLEYDEDILKDEEIAKKALILIGAKRENFGDFSFSLNTLPRVTLAVVYNRTVEEFEPNVSVFFKESAQYYQPTDLLAHHGVLPMVAFERARKAILGLKESDLPQFISKYVKFK
jgi:hypothetical protein